MALVYNKSTISVASATLGAVALQEAFRDALIAHPSGAWTLVEEFDVSTVHWTVLKNAAAQSGEVRDFYFVMGRNASTMTLWTCEGYNSSTNTSSVWMPHGSSSSVTTLADGTSAATYVLSSAIPSAAPSSPAPSPNPIALASMNYATHIDASYAILWSSASNHNAHYVGYGDSLVTGGGVAETGFILGGFMTAPGNGVWAAPSALKATRHLNTVGGGQSYIGTIAYGLICVEDTKMVVQGAGMVDCYRAPGGKASKYFAFNYAAFTTANSPRTPDVAGGLRGTLRGVRLGLTPVAAVVGDTVVIDAKKWLIVASITAGGLWGLGSSASLFNAACMMDTGVAA